MDLARAPCRAPLTACKKGLWVREWCVCPGGEMQETVVMSLFAPTASSPQLLCFCNKHARPGRRRPDFNLQNTELSATVKLI
jgi:hypothetical protein